MRFMALILAILLAPAVLSQEAPSKKKPGAKKQQLAHKKPTPEQIRKFNALQKKKR